MNCCITFDYIRHILLRNKGGPWSQARTAQVTQEFCENAAKTVFRLQTQCRRRAMCVAIRLLEAMCEVFRSEVFRLPEAMCEVFRLLEAMCEVFRLLEAMCDVRSI